MANPAHQISPFNFKLCGHSLSWEVMDSSASQPGVIALWSYGTWYSVAALTTSQISVLPSSLFVSTVPLLPPLFTGMDPASPHASLSEQLSVFGGAYVGNLVTAMCVRFGHSPPTVIYEGSSNAVLLFASQTKMFWSHFCTVGAIF